MKKILFIVIGVLLIGIVSIKASELIESSQVIYKDNNTVSTALDELFQAVDINERLGDTDISGIGDGTVTGAISELTTATSVSLQLSSNVSGGMTAIVKNGWCFVTMEFTPTADAFTSTVATIATGLPKPVMHTFFSLGTASGNNYTAQIDTNGVLRFYYNYYKNIERVDASISYPIA